jgi:GcvH upstream region-like protein
MLQFFRKYQKIFFLVVTFVIVTTFLFFGTYQAMAPSFRKGEGESYTAQVVRFLETENWMISRRNPLANFLNDGVISKEFLETGMGELVAQKYPERFQEDFTACHVKEKTYISYVHPTIPSLSAEMIWSMFAPDMSAKLKTLQEGNGSFKDRCALLLAQKQFPPTFLSQVLHYQEQNILKANQDPRLAKDDMTLFGYQTLSDWFGSKYMTTLAELLIETAQVARKLGYKVSKEEVLADLLCRSNDTFQEIKGKIPLPVQNGHGLMQLYVGQMGMTEETVLKIWEDVTLFRRLMHEVGDAALVDTLPMSQFFAFAYENATIELFQSPSHCRLKSLEEMQQLEAYIAAVSNKSSPLDIPQEYASVDVVASRAPDLVGRRYTISFVHTSKKALQAKVSIKETLDWECDPSNWSDLKRQFPELAQKTGTPFEILEKMDPKGKKLVDAYARKQIVDSHPEWVQEALSGGQIKEKELFLSRSPSQKTFEGITNPVQLADELMLRTELVGYTQDQNNYYSFYLKDHDKNEEILTFKEALKSGVLPALVSKLEAKKLVQEVVDACPSSYKEMAFAYRFAPFIAAQWNNISLGKLGRQFAPEKKEKTITRCEKGFIPLDDIFTLQMGSYSDVKVDAVEGAYFYRFVDKREDKTVPVEKLIQMQSILSKEARCKFFDTCLKKSSL